MSFFPVLVGDPLNPLWDVRKMGRDMSCNQVYVSVLCLLRSLTILESKGAEIRPHVRP